tara:strand:+ start:43 stop:564 length:522 start_codon:yes stop_codon:yes gene_type:complete
VINLKFFRTILIFIFFASTCNAENIAYANLDTIVNTSEVGKKIISNFAKKNNKLLESFKADEQKIKEKEKKIISQKNILQENEYISKVNLLRQEVNLFNESNNKKLNDLKLNRDKILESFLKEINKILSEFAEQNKIDLILSSKQIIIGKSHLDVTNDILTIVNKKIKGFKIE